MERQDRLKTGRQSAQSATEAWLTVKVEVETILAHAKAVEGRREERR